MLWYMLQSAGISIQLKEGAKVHCLWWFAQPKGRLGKAVASLRLIWQGGAAADDLGHREKVFSPCIFVRDVERHLLTMGKKF